MEAYNTPLKNTMEPLDFTSAEKKAASSSSEPLVLDLTCKKEVSPSSQQGTSWNSRQNSLISNGKQLQGSLFPGSRQRSPIESRIFAMTPPSESDSPKKMKYESIDNYFNALSKKPINQLDGLPMLPTTLPMPQQFPPNNSVALPMAGTSATTSSTATPHGNDAEMTLDMGKKMPRPFKAYPKDPLSLSMGSAEMMYNQNSNDAYSEFRKRMLESVKKSNEGTNIKMKRVTKSPTLPTSTVDDKDAAYWERRRKNNEAAKRSRDARRAKEDEIAIRAAFLERENMQLRYELAALKDEMAKLRSMMYSS